METSYVSVPSPVGPWTVEGTDRGVRRVFLPHQDAPRATSDPSRVVAQAARQLDEYFRGERTTFDVALEDTPATPFQLEVWRVLRSIPFGTVATYSRVAELTGRPRAARAVGNANHANPWPVIVPCHRVVASHGLGGYGGGEDAKRFLLSLEGVEFPS
jgi:methylated-DNA-[protein]-cysteine S-methyltransferase